MSDPLVTRWQVGDFVRVGPHLGVAVPLPADWALDPEDTGGLDHTGVWYGQYDSRRPLVRTVPVEYVERAAPLTKPSFRRLRALRDPAG
jgi:hypothetical protein